MERVAQVFESIINMGKLQNPDKQAIIETMIALANLGLLEVQEIVDRGSIKENGTFSVVDNANIDFDEAARVAAEAYYQENGLMYDPNDDYDNEHAAELSMYHRGAPYFEDDEPQDPNDFTDDDNGGWPSGLDPYWAQQELNSDMAYTWAG